MVYDIGLVPCVSLRFSFGVCRVFFVSFSLPFLSAFLCRRHRCLVSSVAVDLFVSALLWLFLSCLSSFVPAFDFPRDAYIAVIRLVESVDDTISCQKTILSELLKPLEVRKYVVDNVDKSIDSIKIERRFRASPGGWTNCHHRSFCLRTAHTQFNPC